MSSEALYEPPLMAHLLIEGLNRYNDEPCLFLGDKVASYREVRENTSQMVQALKSKGLGVGSRIAVISANRPEVLSNIAAMQLTGAIGTPLHPLGSLDDHAYVLEAAEIEALVFDSALFSEVAAALKERVPGIKHFLGLAPTRWATTIWNSLQRLIHNHWLRRTSRSTISPRSTLLVAPPASPRA